MLKHENGEDRLLSRIQFLGWAIVFTIGLIGGYVKFNSDNVIRDEKAKFLEYQLGEERRIRTEEYVETKNNMLKLANSVERLADKVGEIVEPTKRINKWLDESPNGPRGKQ